MKKLCLLLFFFLFTIIIFSIIFFAIQKVGIEEQIKSRQLIYSYNYGWIDMTHAIPTNTIKFVNKLQHKNQLAIDYYLIDYSQSVGAVYFDTPIKLEIKHTYKIKSNLDSNTLEQIGFNIFAHVSNHFEKIQNVPIMPIKLNSSFQEGDMTGNLISFCLATKKITSDSIKKNLNPANILASLMLYEKSKKFKNQKFFPIYYTNNKPVTTPLLFSFYHKNNSLFTNYMKCIKKEIILHINSKQYIINEQQQ